MNTTVSLNITTLAPIEGISIYWGFAAAITSAICYGINYLPVKKFQTGDGMFFQWILANAIFIGSFIVNSARHYPTFHPLVLVGGFLWATGNICVVPIISAIGLGMGLSLWGSASIIIGWASARFGWFGIDPQLPKNYTLNYVGFVLITISAFIYSLVKTDITTEGADDSSEMATIVNMQDDRSSINTSIFKNSHFEIPAGIEKHKSKIIGMFLSIFSGTLYGLMFIPETYVKNRHYGASQSDIDYLFAQCSGIYLGSSFYFIVYCAYKRNSPIIFPKVILPGLLSGTIWFIAYMAYFIANEALSPAISQPIIGAIPGLISLVLGVVWFKEIKGLQNYLILIAAIVISCIGVTLTGLSKVL